MKSTTALTMGDNAMTLLDLFRMAATHKNLRLREGSPRICSEPIKDYTLNEKILAILAKHNIRRRDRPDKIFTLVDENSQENIPGYLPSNYWNFKPIEGDGRLRMRLSIGFSLNIKKRGIMLTPQAHGSYVSATDQLPNFRMFRTLVNNDNDAPTIAKELATSDGTIVITWTELGLGGIRRLTDLFNEFAAGNKTVIQLSKNKEVFNPTLSSDNQKPGDELFIPESAQPQIFEKWQRQLEEYRSHLRV